ncbi:MAG: class I SAM-dependent methyltransferase [Planctomycetes bacterium]|nr:class I SAM-dependent methyltransferase [Planctomycetota bacterium]
MQQLAYAFLVLGLAACAGTPGAAATEASVKPGINDSFTDPDLDVDKFVQRFETESREVFANRSRIARAVGLQPGMAVADIGAGTGVFVDFFARDVGTTGAVYAVDIAPKFVDRLRERAATRNEPQVRAVLCTDRDVALPEASVDIVFVCDTYHHFEYPHTTLGSIHRALRPGGQLVIVDFERVPGQSSDWILGHVRCDRATVIQEVTSEGFEFAGATEGLGLTENYFIRFTRQ